MGNSLFLDTETFSALPLRTVGAYRYSEEAEILLVQWAWGDDPVTVWDMTAGDATLADLQALLDAADEVLIFNSAFDRAVMRANGVNLSPEKITDVMVVALQHSLPGKLETLCEVLDLPRDKQKDKQGTQWKQLFTKPRPKNVKIRRATRETHPAEWAGFIEYGRTDVEAMRAAYQRVPTWNRNPVERRLWVLDQAVNDRGIACDLEHATSALRAFDRVVHSLAGTTSALTDGAVGSTTQRAKLLAYLQDTYGYAALDMKKGTVERALRDGVDPEVQALLEIRQQAAATSPAKYKSFLAAVGSDGRVRGTLQFCGAARTGRDASRLVQLQNLPRSPDWFDLDVQETTVAAMKADCEDIIYGDVSDRCVFSVRGTLMPGPGMRFVVSDLSNIEGRVLAWLAGEGWKLEAFKAYDRGEGPDLYKVTAGRILGKPPEAVTKDERQATGKISELSCGFQGALGAFRRMGGIVADSMDDDTIIGIVKQWRSAHPATKNFWYAMERAAKAAIESPGSSHTVRSMITFDTKTDNWGAFWLRMKLPSGRFLCYPHAQIDRFVCERCGGDGEVDFVFEGETKRLTCPECNGSGEVGNGQISYEGIDTYTKQWKRITTYGGQLCIAAGTLTLTDAGWLPIEQVTPMHCVWDGVEWVAHSGLVNKGVTGVISAHGVWMTPDHEVLTERGWVRASQSERFNRAACRLPDGYEIRREQRGEIPVGDHLRLRRQKADAGDRVHQAREEGRNRVVRLPEVGNHLGQADWPRHVAPQRLRHLARYVRPLQAAYASCMAQLRRAGHSCLRGVEPLFPSFLGRHGAYLPRGFDAGSARQRRGLHPAELPLDDARRPSPEHPKQHAGRYPLGRDDCGRTGRPLGDQPHHNLLPTRGRDHLAATGRATGSVAQVFDLVNCGPRRRFTVASADGTPLIVHNCENATQATARDVFMSSIPQAEREGYKVVLRVHDELVCEVPLGSEHSVERLEKIMEVNPSWAHGLPLAAAGTEMARYRKGD